MEFGAEADPGKNKIQITGESGGCYRRQEGRMQEGTQGKYVRCPLVSDTHPLKTEVSSKTRIDYKERRGIKVRKRPKQSRNLHKKGDGIELRI